jgi:hypothetical protein
MLVDLSSAEQQAVRQVLLRGATPTSALPPAPASISVIRTQDISGQVATRH